MIYLQEKGRISSDLLHQLHTELNDGESGFLIADLTLEVAFSMTSVSRTAIPDMPDRIIAATAHQLGLPLISRDRRIQLSDLQTVW
jgi:PIN domain nuclease of toxin-antitoxin system